MLHQFQVKNDIEIDTECIIINDVEVIVDDANFTPYIFPN